MNYFQYVLIGGSLCVSFLMLVAFSEKMNFVGAYSIITLLTTVQVSLFVYGLTKVLKAAQIIGLIFFCEYLFMLMMAHLQPIALLVGSITLFVLISLAMYLSVKLASGNWQQLQ